MQGGGGEEPPPAAPARQVVVQMEPKVAAKSPDVLEYASSPQPSFKAGGDSLTAAAKPLPILRLPTISVRPKSRFVELNYPPPPKHVAFDDAAAAAAAAAATATTATSASEWISDDDGDSDSDWDEWQGENEAEAAAAEQEVKKKNRKRRSKVKWRALAQSAAFMVITACLVSVLTIPSLKSALLWGVAPWKWCVLVLVVFSGRLVAEWLVVFLIERNIMLHKKIVFFVYHIRRSVQNCVWLGLVVLAWLLLFRSTIETSSSGHRRLFSKVSRALLAVLIAAVIWLLKILLVKLGASSFHVATFFDRMKESVFHHYILEALSGPLLNEVEEAHPPPPPEEGKKKWYNFKRWRSTAGRVVGGSKREASSRRTDMEKLRRLSRSRATAWGVKRLVSHITRSGLSTMARTVDETMQNFNDVSEMSSELEARLTAQRVFHRVAGENKKIEEEDLRRFLSEEEVQTILPFFERTEMGHIKKSAFRNWVVRAYKERKALAHALNDTRTAVHQLHKYASAVVIVVILVVSVLVMGFATSKVVLVITSQLLLFFSIFGNTCKIIFESIYFVFFMHPFDAGDRCVVDGVQMIVEEMNIMTTVFLRFDNEKIFYPNSALLTKPISNFNKSPDMRDTVEFVIDVKTTAEKIDDLKARIKMYIDGKPKHWQQKHSVVAREIENVNKMKMELFVQHTMNFQDFPERDKRRSELVLELKKIFEELGIEYHLLPQEVRFSGECQCSKPVNKIYTGM